MWQTCRVNLAAEVAFCMSINGHNAVVEAVGIPHHKVTDTTVIAFAAGDQDWVVGTSLAALRAPTVRLPPT